MNLPNKLTLMRFALVPVFMIFMYTGGKYRYFIALRVFAIASFTDFLDGNIARKNNLVTTFGKFMDPLRDKLLTTVALIYLVREGMCSEIILCIVLAREFAVSGIRMSAAAAPGGGKVIAAGLMGKAKTVFQMFSIMLGLLSLSLYSAGFIGADLYRLLSAVTGILMWIMAGLTVISGLQYIIPNLDLVLQSK